MWCKLHGKTTQWEWIRVNNKSRSTESSCIFNTTTDLFGFFLYVFLHQVQNYFQLTINN